MIEISSANIRQLRRDKDICVNEARHIVETNALNKAIGNMIDGEVKDILILMAKMMESK